MHAGIPSAGIRPAQRAQSARRLWPDLRQPATAGHVYLSPFYVNYNVDALRNRDGNRVDRGGEIDVNAFTLIYQWVSEKKLLGGNYSVLIAPSAATNSLDSPLFNTELKTSWGFGDLYVQPVNLGWHTEWADFTAGIGIFAPTGRYEVGADEYIYVGRDVSARWLEIPDSLIAGTVRCCCVVRIYIYNC